MKKEAIIVTVLTILLLISLQFDSIIINFIESSRVDFTSKIMIFISNDVFDFLLFAILIAAMFYRNRDYKKILLYIFVVGIAYITASILKGVIARPRPDIERLVNVSSYSFPSRHTTTFFSIAPSAFIESKAFGYSWIALSSLIAFSRVYVGAHYLSDVFGGMLVGYIIGIIVTKYYVNYISPEK